MTENNLNNEENNLNNEEKEPIVTMSFLKDTHHTDIMRCMQASDVLLMIYDLRNNIRSSLKHEAPFLGVKLSNNGIEVLGALSDWLAESGDHYKIDLEF